MTNPTSINWRDPNPDIDQIAAALCHRDSFFAISNEEARVEELLQGKIHFRKRLIEFDEWDRPQNLESSLLKSWKFYYHSLVWLAPLRRVYRSLPDQRYREAYLANLRRWLSSFGVPPDPLPTQKDPGNYTWYDMSTAWRTMVIIGAVSIVGLEEDLVEHLARHAAVLMDGDFYAKVGNHALHQNYALMSAALILDRRDYLETALERTDALRRISIDDEGVALEGSANYHLFNMDWWLNMDHQLEQVSRFVKDIPRIHVPDMRPFLRAVIAPDGKVVPLGDSTMTKGPYRNVINEYPDHFVAYIESDPHLLHDLTCGAEGEPPTTTMNVFADGFWFSRNRSPDRDPRRQSHATLKFGPGLAERVHAHDDAGSVTFYPGGIRLVEDGGMFGYYGGDRREFVKSCLAHNAIVVPGRKYYRSAVSPLTNVRSNADFDQAEVEVKALERTRWTRLVAHAHNDDLLVVQDLVSAGDQPFQQLFNLGDGFRVIELSGDKACIQDERGNRAVLLWLTPEPRLGLVQGREKPLMGWRSTFEGELHPVSCITATVGPPAEPGPCKVLMLMLLLAPEEEFGDIAVSKVRLRSTRTLFDLQRKSGSLACDIAFGSDVAPSSILRKRVAAD